LVGVRAFFFGFEVGDELTGDGHCGKELAIQAISDLLGILVGCVLDVLKDGGFGFGLNEWGVELGFSADELLHVPGLDEQGELLALTSGLVELEGHEGQN
jgi:hypothetical protein